MPFEDHYFGMVHPKSRVGCSHSQTQQEFETKSRIRRFVMNSRFDGKKLPNYTKPDWYYCIVEDGRVFKYHSQRLEFYHLDLDRFVWIPDQSYASLIYDTYLKFEEFYEFVDHYPHDSALMIKK